ncbi:MAG: PTS sugar transporter subunit IIA [Tractidigestivibacter sp.]|jgi:PTS system galactitol-specific IIA component|uniref:PTS sugar transporter subunit IIA n=1 Tax=Tractidigestivibacter sp. TaxID=2847320 RepID=UPI003D90310F
MADLTFNSSLVIRIEDEGLTCEDVERRIASVLTEQGYAKDSYAQAIVDREKNFPTALDMGGYNVAIPHCDVENVNKAAFCMAVLAHPVAWHKMDEPDETCPVSVVVMLALTEAHAHLEMLQKVIAFVQDQELVGKVVASKSADEIYALVAPHFN